MHPSSAVRRARENANPERDTLRGGPETALHGRCLRQPRPSVESQSCPSVESRGGGASGGRR
eukprot:650249-Prymnesium_polylepis.1